MEIKEKIKGLSTMIWECTKRKLRNLKSLKRGEKEEIESVVTSILAKMGLQKGKKDEIDLNLKPSELEEEEEEEDLFAGLREEDEFGVTGENRLVRYLEDVSTEELVDDLKDLKARFEEMEKAAG